MGGGVDKKAKGQDAGRIEKYVATAGSSPMPEFIEGSDKLEKINAQVAKFFKLAKQRK